MSIVSTGPRPALGCEDLHFAAGIPGFPQAKSFKVSPWGTGSSPFLVLDCADVAGLRFVAAEPTIFFPWYQPAFGPEVHNALGSPAPEELAVLAILTLHSRPEETTFNLLGPLVVNTSTGEAVQAVLAGSGYDPQTPIVPRA